MKRIMIIGFVLAAFLLGSIPVQAEIKDIKWGTSAVGSSGYRALVNLTALLNREMPKYRFTALPTPGAVVSVKGYAMGKFDGYYGADVAFWELAQGINRFKGFKAQMKRQPVQSFWTYTIEIGVAIHSKDRDKYKRWMDLSGKKVFTGPLPWDVRAHLERALKTLGVKHKYLEVDLSTVGSVLNQGVIDGFLIYTTAEATISPWIVQTSLVTDFAVLNPSQEEIETLRKAGFAVVEVDPKVFKKDVYVDKAILFPFYYGFHLGLEIPEEDVYQILNIIERKAKELAKADKAFKQISKDMAGMQRRGVEAAAAFVPIHPGLAKWMKEKGVWDPKWDARVAR
jgi:hypothetical protein